MRRGEDVRDHEATSGWAIEVIPAIGAFSLGDGGTHLLRG